MNNKIIFILADGFEEIEAFTPIDFLRRLNFEVVTVSADSKKVTGAHDIIVDADMILSDLSEIPKGVVLPGGMPGSINLQANENVIELVRNTYKQGKLVAAICAAQIVLYAAGVLDNKKITSHPSVKNLLGNSVNYTGSRVECDENIITAKGAGVSFEFAVKIAEFYGKKEEADAMLDDMYVVTG